MGLTQTISSQASIGNIVIYGNSAKFISIMQSLFPDARITILPWRTSEQEATTILAKPTTSLDLLFICGYDYGSYNEPENQYLNNNVRRILSICKMIADNTTKIIYIDTLRTNKSRTYSRYLHAKKLLGRKLKAALPQTQILSIPTVFDQQNQIGMQGGMISKMAAKVLIQLGIIQTINLVQLQDQVKSAIQSPGDALDSPSMIQPILTAIPRPQLIDRTLRILLG